MSQPPLMQIVNDVLDFSKIESGKLELHGTSKSVSIDASGY
jgi:signal transduction histidine kinase